MSHRAGDNAKLWTLELETGLYKMFLCVGVGSSNDSHDADSPFERGDMGTAAALTPKLLLSFQWMAKVALPLPLMNDCGTTPFVL